MTGYPKVQRLTMIGIYSKGEAPDSGKYELWVDGAGFSEFLVAESCGIGNRH